MPIATTAHGRGTLLAAVGVVVLSFDALLIRLAATNAWDVTFWRGWGMFLSMGLCWLLASRRLGADSRRAWLAAGGIAVLYGVDMGLFVFSIANTHTANTVVIVASAPFFAALASRLFLGESIAWRTAVAIVVSLAGVLVVFAGSLGAGSWRGDGVALVLAMSMGVTLTVLRSFPGLDRLAVIAMSGAVAGLLAWPLADPWSLTVLSYGWLALMGGLQIPLATMLIMSATRFLPAPEVSLFLLIETVLAPIWVWLVVAEQPPPLTLYGGGLVLATVAVHSALALRVERLDRL